MSCTTIFPFNKKAPLFKTILFMHIIGLLRLANSICFFAQKYWSSTNLASAISNFFYEHLLVVLQKPFKLIY